MSTVLRLCVGRAAGAVGHRHERRIQPRQLGQRAAEVALALVGLRREELEGEGTARPSAQALVDSHRGRSLGGGASAPVSPASRRPRRPRRAPRGGAASTASWSSARAALGVHALAVDARRSSYAVAAPTASAARTASRRSATSRRLASTCPCDVRERPPVAAERQPRVERVDRVERGQELADGVGRPAEVEVQRDAPEQVVAGDQQAALGQVQAHVRGRVARASRAPASRRGRWRPSTPSTRSRAGSTRPATGRGPGCGGCSAHRRSGSSGTPLWRAISTRRASIASTSSAAAREVLVARVQPQLAARALLDRARLPAVVGVRVRADEQAHVLERQADVLERAPRGGRASPARASRCRRARSRRRPRAPTRCSAGRPATAAAAAAARRRGSPSRRGRSARGRVGLRIGRTVTCAAMPSRAVDAPDGTARSPSRDRRAARAGRPSTAAPRATCWCCAARCRPPAGASTRR